MQTLLQDQYYRAQLNRKRQIYKNMLDQQIRYKNQQKQRELYPHPQIRVSSQPKQYNHPTYQSPITKTYANGIMHNNQPYNNTPLKTDSNYQYQTEKDTEKHLNNCQQIIKNLRELKQKRKKKELAPIKIDSISSPRNQGMESPIKNRPQFNYYPKNNYFSNYLWRKEPERQQSKFRTKRQSSKQLKTLENRLQLPDQNPQKIRKSLKMPSKYKLSKKNNKYSNKSLNNTEEKNNQLDSQQPLGIKVKYSPTNQLKRNSKSKSPKSSKSKDKKKKSKTNIISNRQNQQQTPIVDQQTQIQRKQLYDCLTQLKKYLKLKSEQMDRINNVQKVNQEIQVDVIDSSREQKQKKNHINQLKLKALIKLRQLNQKSKEFLIKMGGGDKKDRRQYQKRTRQKSRSQLSQLLEKSIKKQNSDEKTKSLVNQQTNTDQRQVHSRSVLPPMQSKDKIYQDSKQNEQLLLAINQQLNRQQIQNQELTNCLKELSQYLKNQNQQIENIKNSRIQNLQPLKKTEEKNKINTNSKSRNSNNSPVHQFRFQQFPKRSFTNETKQPKPTPKKLPTPQEDSQLKQAFLKRLKKARLRGKLLNQKIQTYKKIHIQKIEQTPHTQIQNNPPNYSNQSQQPLAEQSSPQNPNISP